MFAKFDSRWIFVALAAAVITLAICYALSKKTDADSAGQLVPCSDCSRRGRQCR